MDIGDAKLKIGIEGAEEAKGKLQELGTSMEQMSGAFKKAGLALTGFGAAITGVLTMTVKAYAGEEAGITRLSMSLAAIGVSYNEVKEQLEAVISATQRKTSIADDQQREALSRLVGITDDYTQALSLLPLVLDLSVAKQMDVVSAAEVVGRVAQGNIGILSRYGIVLTEGASASEALAEMQKKFAGQAEAYGSTLSGQFALLKDTVGDLAESIGEVLAPAVKAIVEFFSSLLEKIKELPGPVRTAGVVIAAIAGAVGLLAGNALLAAAYLPKLIIGIKAAAVAITTHFVPALIALIAKTWAWIAAQVVALALMGPKGWAILAAGAALAAGAIYGLTKMVQGLTSSLDEAIGKMQSAARAEKLLFLDTDNTNKGLSQQAIESLRAAEAKGRLAEAAAELEMTEQQAKDAILEANKAMTNQEIAAYVAKNEKKDLSDIADELGISERKLKRILDETNVSLEKQGDIAAGSAQWSLGAGIAPLPAFPHGGIVTKPTIAMVGEVPEMILPLRTAMATLAASFPKVDLGDFAMPPMGDIVAKAPIPRLVASGKAPLMSLDETLRAPNVTNYNYEIELKAGALMGNNAEARQWARTLLDYMRQDQRRKGPVTI